MQLTVYPDKAALSQAAAVHAATLLRDAIAARGQARLVAATGTSQIPFLAQLTAAPGIDWSAVELFHLDEYVGLPLDHPASFRKYMVERLIRPAGIRRYHLLDGEQDVPRAVAAANAAIGTGPIDIAFVGIGENGHLAFNDPPADFQTEDPYIVVALDAACRQQQVGEGWFPSLDAVPTHAISMSIRQILKAQQILCLVPDQRKAAAVKACFEGEISPLAPASILRTHPQTTVYLDRGSASQLQPGTLQAGRV